MTRFGQNEFATNKKNKYNYYENHFAQSSLQRTHKPWLA